MKEHHLKIITKPTQTEEMKPSLQGSGTQYSILKEPTPVKKDVFSSWSAGKSSSKEHQALLDAQAEQTYMMEYERTAQICEKKSFFSGLLQGGNKTFLWTVSIGGISLFVWKMYLQHGRTK